MNKVFYYMSNFYLKKNLGCGNSFTTAMQSSTFLLCVENACK